ncbi:MAG: hypothetical protein K2Z80_30625 [Xanthobacteraceae bacterium]|nr:hypothetical protein [Xanthobacteraceae bacterium]
MTIRSRGARIPNTAWCSEAVHLAFLSRHEPEYGVCTMQVQSHRKARRTSSVALQTLDTVTVTFSDHGAEQEPVVSAERADQDDTLDLPGAPVHTIVFRRRRYSLRPSARSAAPRPVGRRRMAASRARAVAACFPSRAQRCTRRNEIISQ